MNHWNDTLHHHGILGQKWGVRHGPPYPLYRQEEFKNGGAYNKKITGGSAPRYSHKRDRNAVNDIYNSMTDKEKWFLAGNVTDNIVPKEYVSKEEYGPNSTLANTTIVWERETPVAFCDVWINRPREGDIAIGTRGGNEYRGKGYATKAAQEAIKWFKENDNLDVLCYYPHTGNKASIALAKKLGFEVVFSDEQVTGLELRKRNELYHHGRLGQRWGVQNGPPYPLDKNQFSRAEKSAIKSFRKRSTEEQGGLQRSSSFNSRKALKIGATIAVTALVAYGGYKLYKSGALDNVIKRGKELASKSSARAVGSVELPKAPKIIENGFTKLEHSDTVKQAMKVVNPYSSQDGGSVNCSSCSAAGFFRTNSKYGYDVISKPMFNRVEGDYFSKIVKNFDKQSLQGTASVFGRSMEDGQRIILKKFGEDGAEGVLKMTQKSGNGHFFNWKVENGQVKFFDYQQNHDSDNFDFRRYWDVMDRNREFIVTRLDNAEFNWEEVDKLVRKQ